MKLTMKTTMKKERSVGVVIFRREGSEVKYLLLHYTTKTKHWDFPKGHVEKGETPKETAIREAEEETGIKDLKFLEGFSKKYSYYYTEEESHRYKEVEMFLAETKTKEIKISQEHIGSRWADFESAKQQLTYENGKEVLIAAEAFLLN